VGLGSEPDVVRTVTLSKSLGSQGGAVLGPVALRDHLVDTARAFVFDTGLAPSSAGAALTALDLVTDELVGRLASVGARLADALGVSPTPGAVVRLLVGDPFRATAARDRCRAEGVRVGCFRPPSVPAGEACLRVTARADLSDAEVSRAADVVRQALTPPAG
jgi:8-amino-7-oxononanoate synthase